MSILQQRYWRLLLLIPFALVVAAYFQTVDHEYVWDDNIILLRSADLRAWDSIWSHMGKAFLSHQEYFRPLPLLTLGMEQLLFDGGPFVSHLVAVLLFSSIAVLVALLAAVVAELRGLPPRQALAAGVAAGTFYALHPALIETGAWISCRFDLMLTLFCLLMLLSDRLLLGKPMRVPVVTLFWFLAALSKETALGAALALPLWHLQFARAGGARQLWNEFRAERNLHVYAAIFAAGLVYLALRFEGASEFYQKPNLSYEPMSLQHLLCMLKTIGGFLKTAAWPFVGLGPVHPLAMPISMADPLVITGFFWTVLMGILLLSSYRGARMPLGFLLPFSAALMPTINLIPLQIGGSYLNERFLTFPLVFGAVALPLLARQLWQLPIAISPRVKQLIAACIVLTWTGLCVLNLHATIPFWRNNLSLWTLAYMRAPDSTMSHTNLQAAYVNAGLYQEAKTLTENYVRRNKGKLNVTEVENYLWALTGLGLPRGAAIRGLVGSLERGGLATREKSEIYSQCAWLLMLDGELVQSKDLLLQALQMDPRRVSANYRIAVLYLVEGKPESAQPYLKTWRTYVHPSERSFREANIPMLVNRIGKLNRERKSVTDAKQAEVGP